MKTTVLVFALVLLATFGTSAQDRLSIEFRPSANLATQDLGNTHIDAGGGFETTAAFVFLPHLGAYIGWGWNSFGSDDIYAGSPIHFVENGYTFGLQYIRPIGDRSLSYMIRAGGIANHIEIENDTEILADTKHGLGWQVEGGLNVPVGDRWSLRPSLRYRSLTRDATFGGITTPLDLRYLSLGLGVAWSL